MYKCISCFWKETVYSEAPRVYIEGVLHLFGGCGEESSTHSMILNISLVFEIDICGIF